VSRADLVSSRPALEDEREFLLRSLRDLDAEREAGDLGDEDFRTLHDRYTARTAEVLRALALLAEPEAGATGAADFGAVEAEAADTTTDAGSRPHRRRRRLVLAVGVVAFAGAAVAVVVSATGDRLPGSTATGSPSLGRAQQIQRQLAQGASLEQAGQVVEALRLYRQVLAEDPTQSQALAESGWLEFQAGVQAQRSDLVSQAQSQEQAAVRADPGAYAPHLYLGSMLLVEGDAQGAVAEFRSYLAADPPASSVQNAAPFITRAFTAAGLAPPSLPGA
jgi:tetratricopeptide (TPR) repeat protein